jgi:hypothetical protein
MVKGALAHSHAQVGVAISGIAGPSGGTLDKPVGTVWIAYAFPHNTSAQRYYFSGNRNNIREQSVITALRQLVFSDRLESKASALGSPAKAKAFEVSVFLQKTETSNGLRLNQSAVTALMVWEKGIFELRKLENQVKNNFFKRGYTKLLI